MRLTDKLRPLGRFEPWVVVGPLVVVQWLALVAFVVTVRHNGWLFYQGGDQTFFYTSSWIVGHGHIPDAAIGWGWSYVLVPITWIFGSSFLTALPAIILIQTVILLPLGLIAVYLIAERIGGRLLGYISAGLWVALPYAVIPLWDHRYHGKYVEQFLPQALGLTGLGDFPSMIIVLWSAYFVVRSLDTRALAGCGCRRVARGVRDRGQAVECAVPRRRGARVAGRAAVAWRARVRRRTRAAGARADALESARARDDPALRADGGPRRRRRRGRRRRLELGTLEVPPLQLGRATAELRRDPRVLLERPRAAVDRDRRVPRRASTLATEGAAPRRLVRGVSRCSRAARRRRISRRARSSASSCPGSRRS